MLNMPMMDMPMKDMPMLNKPMNDMPMMNKPMKDMPMMDKPMKDMPMMNMPMKDMPMMNMPMMNMPECMDDDKDLKMLYPKIYNSVNPMIKHHCNMMESIHGTMHCPSKDEMYRICKDICDKHEKHHMRDDEDDYDDKDDDMTRRRRYGRRRGISDLARILIIRNLIGRRGRRGGYWG